MKIAVIMGGTSSEREISLKSGDEVLQSLKRQGYDAYAIDIVKENEVSAFIENDFDLAFLTLHGGSGENGQIQALLELLGKKYTGSRYQSCAIAMNKKHTKMIAKTLGIKVIKDFEKIEDIDSYPVMVKPNQEGSSIGIHICDNAKEVEDAIKLLKDDYVIEEYIDGVELTSAVYDKKSLGVIKIIPLASQIYDYEAKYANGGSIHEFPAKIDKSIYDLAMKNAELIHNALEMRGVSRSDFLLKDGTLYFLEVNTTPGMTETSLIPDLFKMNGYSFDDYTRMIVEMFK